MGSPMSQVTRNKRRRRGRGKSRNKAFLALMVLGIVAVLAGLGAVGYVVSIAASAPPLTSLKPKAPGNNTRVYAADGQSLGWIQADDLHLPMTAKEVPKVVKDATIAIEDERYYKHKGVDYEGVVRAAVKNFSSRKTVQGGSTITMQLVRSLYISSERTYERKIREAKLAEELEKAHSKEWILDKYLDSIPYGTVGGQSAIGIKAAARIFFSKRLEELNLHEAALLAGLPQAPSDYSPTRAPGAAKKRRNEVLRKMEELGMITPAAADRATKRKLGVKLSSYFSRRREKYFFDYVKDQLFREYGARTVRVGGMKVYTTIDLDKQQEARAAIERNLGTIGPSSAIVTINPKNGYIEAMASSGDYGVSKFNLAAQGHRRPGSTFKVMALMTALRKGVNPDSTHYVSKSPTVVRDSQYGNFEIRTYGGKGAGNMSLRKATLASDNSVYIQLAMDLGPDEVKKTARDMGITSTLKGYPAETLGGLENGVSPLEMATAYASIASQGYRLRPTAIKRIELPGGRVEKGKAAPAPLPRQAHPDLLRRCHVDGHADPRAEHPVGHGRARGDRLPGGRQDRHDRPEHGCLVRRLHAAPDDRRLGRIPGPRRADERALLRRQRRRRHLPGADLGRLHVAHQGQVLRRLRVARRPRSPRRRSMAGTRAPAAA